MKILSDTQVYGAALPELILLFSILSVIIIGVFKENSANSCRIFTLSSLTFIGIVLIKQIFFTEEIGFHYSELYKFNYLTQFIKLMCVLFMLLTLVNNKLRLLSNYHDMFSKPEFYAMMSLMLFGQMVVSSSNNFIMVYLGLELITLVTSTLITFNRTQIVTNEAAIKYLILSAFGSMLLLYGVSMIYGATSLIGFEKLFRAIEDDIVYNNIALLIGVVFFISSILLKVGIFPFHFWVPDVYQGAPLPIMTIMSTSQKFVMFSVFFYSISEIFHKLVAVWTPIFLILCAMSIVMGNIMALRQNNLKRLLAYSSIANTGFFFSGFILGAEQTNFDIAITFYSNALLYLISYTIATLGILNILSILSGDKLLEFDSFKHLNGLAKKTFLHIGLFIFVSSLAGLPPFLGFYAKFFIISMLIESGYTAYAVAILIASLIGVAYYLRILKTIYFDKPTSHEVNTYEINKNISFTQIFLFTLNLIFFLVLSCFPEISLNLCKDILSSSMLFTI